MLRLPHRNHFQVETLAPGSLRGLLSVMLRDHALGDADPPREAAADWQYVGPASLKSNGVLDGFPDAIKRVRMPESLSRMR